MKKLSVLILSLLFMGCSTQEPYIKLANRSLLKVTVITVMIELNGEPGEVSGSGVLISKYGHILTCAHLFRKERNYSDITVSFYDYKKKDQKAKVLTIDYEKDLALIKVNCHTPIYAKLAYSNNLKVGQRILAIGHPFGHDWTVTHGIISRVNASVAGQKMTQIDAAIGPGNSGGPLFNMDGEVIGINVRAFTPLWVIVNSGLAFAVSAKDIKRFLFQFKGLEQ